MPNHCANLLIVTGNAADLKAFKAMAKAAPPTWDGKGDDGQSDWSDLELNAFVPIPESVLNASSEKNGFKHDAFNSGGYEWCCNNWGTKWGAYNVSVEGKSGELRYRFQTAWAPPSVNVIEAMSAKFPRLRFMLKYSEQGADYSGIQRVGWMWDKETTQYGTARPEVDEDLCELADHSG